MIIVERVDVEATLQDEGRRGYSHLGVPRAGAADLASYRLGARLTGNSAGAAAIEFTWGGLALRVDAACILAVTGANAPVSIDGRAVARNTPHFLSPGSTLEVGVSTHGLRGYVSVRGGLDVPPVLGSRSRDTLAGLGPEPLRPGDRLPVGQSIAGLPAYADAVVDSFVYDGEIEVEFVPGPREDCFTAAAISLFRTAAWAVTSDIDRVGARLEGPALEHVGDTQIPSEPMHLGSVQVPQSGQPIVFLANHPTTGGYPVIGVVAARSIPALAQARPGATVRFRPVSVR